MSTTEPTPSEKTISYYNCHAQQFNQETNNLDMQALYAPFLACVPLPAKILDAGCGSARDAAVFQAMGYEVEAFDASLEMVKIASIRLGKPVFHQKFQAFESKVLFDGIWACASLLHVSNQELPEVLQRLSKALVIDGVLYASFKYGDSEVWRNGRFFNDQTLETIVQITAIQSKLILETYWITADVRPFRHQDQWLNLIFRKT